MQHTRTVVITRPDQQAQAWIDAFQGAGLDVVHIPLLRIEPVTPNKPLKDAWEQLDKWSWVMFVSTNAVTCFFDACPQGMRFEEGWPEGVRVGAVGKGTAGALVAAGVPAELIDQPKDSDQKDSEHLWALIQHRDWQGAQVLVVRGSSEINWPERNWLIEQLQHAGADTQALAVYARCAPQWSNLQKEWINSAEAAFACWLFTSSEGVHYLPQQDWSKAIAVVTHPRIGEAVKLRGFTEVIYTQPELHVALNSVQYVARSHGNRV